MAKGERIGLNPGHTDLLRIAGILRPDEKDISPSELITRTILKRKMSETTDALYQDLKNRQSVINSLDFLIEDLEFSLEKGSYNTSKIQEDKNGLRTIRFGLFYASVTIPTIATCARIIHWTALTNRNHLSEYLDENTQKRFQEIARIGKDTETLLKLKGKYYTGKYNLLDSAITAQEKNLFLSN